MADELVCADASQAIVLADARHEEALATLEDTAKRKAGTSEQPYPKKGKRWGLADDKPFRPLPYVDLPVGLSEKEVDQFLREQRLEDLHRKLQLHQLEDADPDIRAPSPPPVYDRAGNRLNTREVRTRKTMMAEYNRLIRYMIKTIEGYVPPPDWKPQKLVKKVIIPYERYPQAPFMGVIIGARGVNHKRLQETTGCRIFIRGRDIGDKWQTDEELQMPQHVHIEADTEDQIAGAEKLIMPLLNPESPEFEYARTHGMQQLAIVNGFTLDKKEQRCGVCGAVGHLGFECPETNQLNYKMADVVCSICGDRGHTATDCKQTAEKHKQENVDWKVEAEKKHAMEAEYNKMMNELGLAAEKPNKGGPVWKTAVQAKLLASQRSPQLLPRPLPEDAGQGGKVTPSKPASVEDALVQNRSIVGPVIRPPMQAAAARPATQATPSKPPPVAAALPSSTPAQSQSMVGPVLRPPMIATTGRPVTQAPLLRPTTLAPRVVPPAVTPSRRPAVAQPKLVLANPAALGTRLAVLAGGQAPIEPRATKSQSSTQGSPQPAIFSSYCGPDTDDSIICPSELVERLIRDDGFVLKDMSEDTGAQVCIDQVATAAGRRFLITGSLEARERAVLHIRAWLDVNMRAAGLTPPGFSGSLGGFPSMPFQTGLMEAIPAAGFPPAGFPPGMGPECIGEKLPEGFPPGMCPPPVGLFPPMFNPHGLPPEIYQEI